MTTTTTTEIVKCYTNSILFDAQNNGNCISELLDFTFFWGEGECPQTPPPQGKGAYGPFSGHNRLLNLQQLLITVVETPQGAARVVYTAVENMAPEQKQA